MLCTCLTIVAVTAIVCFTVKAIKKGPPANGGTFQGRPNDWPPVLPIVAVLLLFASGCSVKLEHSVSHRKPPTAVVSPCTCGPDCPCGPGCRCEPPG